MELKIVDGELLFRGPTAFSGYYRDPENTAKTITADGWVRTGDIVNANADGTFTFVGRLKDMLKVGGENVGAAEIEGYLLTHPAVDVAAVVAAPDARYGEVPCAYVRLAPGVETSETELIEYCLGSIATFKVPRYVRVVDTFPLTPTEKIQKVVLREWIATELSERRHHRGAEAQRPASTTRRNQPLTALYGWPPRERRTASATAPSSRTASASRHVGESSPAAKNSASAGSAALLGSNSSRCPSPGTSTTRLLDISRASTTPLAGGTSRSHSPETTSVGASMRCSHGRLVYALPASTWLQ